MRVVLEAMESLGLPLEDSLNECHVQTIFMKPYRLGIEQLSTEVVDAIKSLYMDSGVRECLKRAREYHLNDGAE